MSLWDSLPHSVTIYGPPVVTQKPNSKAYFTTWPTIRSANVPCLILQGTGTERDEFDQEQRQVAQHTIAFSDNDGGIQSGDKLVDDNTGKTYRFTGDRPQQGVGGIGDFNIITVRELITGES